MEAPEKALKYHEALLKRPHQAALFDRFYGAWLDEQSLETLGVYLKAQAEAEGGQNWTLLAAYELQRGNEDQALVAWAKAIERLPDDLVLPMERGKLRLRRLEFAEARSDLTKVTAAKDEVLALEAAKLIGKSWLREGKTAEAIKAWDTVLAAHSGDEDLLEDLVETAAAESETAQALRYVDLLIAASKDPYQKTLRMLRRGDLLLQTGKSDEAVIAYTTTLDQVGEGSWLEREVLTQIEKVFRKQDRLDDLTVQLKKLAETYPQRLLIHRQLAKLEASQGQTDAAIGRFREVLKRSPGDRELREEFVRLLSDGEHYDDAAAELSKLIELFPQESGLYLQVAALRFRQGKPEEVLAALQKAHELLGAEVSSGLRIAGLMLQYNLKEPGETLLKELAGAAGAGPIALETLAAEYGRTERKPEAIELLKKAAASDDIEILLRITGAIAALGANQIAYETLTAQAEKFPAEPRFLAALAKSALAAGKAEEVVPQVRKLVRLSKQTTEISESIALALRVIAGAKKTEEARTSLADQASRTAAETCLLASLMAEDRDFVEVEKLLDSNTDPLVLHYHAALLDRRNDFDTAIAVLSRLADTEEGKKAAYFKDLSELQQRAGKTVEALATVERWKQTAPGDKAAWITGSRLLRESGQPEEAVKMTRQAVARFEGDTDLAASLATLQVEAGLWADAEAIYWRLYDEAQSPADQAQWAAQLAQLSQRTGKSDALEEKLRERAKSNRKSIGPLLAQAELARVTNNEEKRRDLLLDAVRLQPKDVDLRIQIATLEEQSGNPERVLAVLEEALPYDLNGRARSALAQAYLRQGQAVKGMRELRLLAGKSGLDARSAESAAATLVGMKLYDEAISLLRSELPDGGDWRSRYLLAVLLEEDGHEAEALPIFLSLLQAQGEIPALVVPAVSSQNYVDQLSRDVRALQELIEFTELAFAHRSGSRQSVRRQAIPGIPSTEPFVLPNKIDEVRQFSLIHLCGLSNKKGGGVDESIRSQIKTNGIDNTTFICDLIARNENTELKKIRKLLQIHPDQPGLYEWFVRSIDWTDGTSPLDVSLTRHALEHEEKLSPWTRFFAWSLLAKNGKAEDPAWASMFTAAKLSIEQSSADDSDIIVNDLTDWLSKSSEAGGLPEVHRAEAKRLLLSALKMMMEKNPENLHDGHSLRLLAVAGTHQEWLNELNLTIRHLLKNTAQNSGVMQIRTQFGQDLKNAMTSSAQSNSGRNPWSSMAQLFVLPTIKEMPIRSIPIEVQAFFLEVSEDIKSPMEIGELLNYSDQLESLFLRAWLAAKISDKDALAKAMAVTPTTIEISDFEILRAILLTQEKKPTEAFAALLKARAASGSNREISVWVNMSLIAVAGTMTPEERTAISADLEATFLQFRPLFGQQGAYVLAAKAAEFGLEELAVRINPVLKAVATTKPGGASATQPAGIASGSSGNPTTSGNLSDKIQNFISANKFEAAARLVEQNIRYGGSNGSNYYFGTELPPLLSALGPEGQAQLLKFYDASEIKSLKKRLEYIDLCYALKRPELILPLLESLLKERPDDDSISARLVLMLPADQSERKIKLMNIACSSEIFVDRVQQAISLLETDKDPAASLLFFEMVTRWLETADPQALSNVNLSWLPYDAKEFMEGHYTKNLPSLLSPGKEPEEKKDTYRKFRMLSERLARAMIRYAPCAEEGFRLLNALNHGNLDPAEMDELAKKALLATASGDNDSELYFPAELFQLIGEHLSQGASGSLYDECSSVSWLVRRSKEMKSPSEILTPEFLFAVQELNPDAGKLMKLFTCEMTSEDLASIWKTKTLFDTNSCISNVLRPTMIRSMASAPSATKFFIDQINAITPGTAASDQIDYEEQEKNLLLFSTALQTTSGKYEDMELAARAVTRAIFGEKLDFNGKQTDPQLDERLMYMGELTNRFSTDCSMMVRYQSAFFRLGIPVANSTSDATQPFRDKIFYQAEEAESFLQSLGWLNEVQAWEPFAGIIYETSSPATGRTQVIFDPTLLTEEALGCLNYQNPNQDALFERLRQRLKERKKGRFGSLMTAAALSRGKDRTELIEQAFREAAAAISKLSPERLKSLEVVMPWLTEEVRAKLPAELRRKLDHLDTKKSQEVIVKADQFLAALNEPGAGQSMINCETLVSSLISTNVEKAVEVFNACERAYTASLGRGGQFTRYPSDDYQLTQRDASFGEIMKSYDDGGSSYLSHPKRQLEFLSLICASPCSKRLNFEDTSYSDHSVFNRAATILLKDDESKGSSTAQILRMVEAYKVLDPELKPMAFNCFMLAEIRGGTDNRDEQMMKQISNLVGKDPQLERLVKYRKGLIDWGAMQPEEKAELRKLFAGVITDTSIPDVVRVMIAAQAVEQIPEDGLLDEMTLSALVKVYQNYCAGERSAVSRVSSSQLFETLAKYPLRGESALPMYAALANAFWENTAAAKPAGHPKIPISLAQSAFIITLMGQDQASITRVFPRIRTSLTGRLVPIFSLLRLGHADLAKMLAPLPAEPFLEETTNLQYTKELENSIAALRTAGADPLTMLKLEIELLTMPLGRDAEAPAESEQARTARLAEAFIATPPEGFAFPRSMHNLLCKAPNHEKLLALAVKWSKEHPFNGFLLRNQNSPSEIQQQVTQAAIRLHGMLAMRAFGAGDASVLEAIHQLIDQPLYRGASDYQSAQVLIQLMQGMTLTIWIDICTGNTTGYKTGMRVWNEFVILCVSQMSRYSSTEIHILLASTQLIAGISGEPFALDSLIEKLPEEDRSRFKELSHEGEFFKYLEVLRNPAFRAGLPESLGTQVFLEKVLSQPGFAKSLTTQAGWVKRLNEEFQFTNEIEAISVNPPATLIPESLPGLYEFAGQVAFESNHEKGIALTRKGLENCPVGDEWNGQRDLLKKQLADQLLAPKKPDKAEEIFDN